MSEPQATKKRVRRRNLAVQLQIALDDAANAMTADISVQKLVQTRLDCLLTMQARERNDKLKRLTAEIERLKQENLKLHSAPSDSVAAALLAHAKKTGGL